MGHSSGSSQLASSPTHAELPIELVGEQGVWQLSKVELAEGGHAVDVLQEGWARQFRYSLTVKLVPETSGVGKGKDSDQSHLTWTCPSIPFLELYTNGCQALPQTPCLASVGRLNPTEAQARNACAVVSLRFCCKAVTPLAPTACWKVGLEASPLLRLTAASQSPHSWVGSS